MKPAPGAAATKIKMLQASMQCLGFGLFSFVPILGFPFAIAALWISGRVRVMEKQHWNAARGHRIVGTLCATITSIVWFFVIALLVYHVFSPDAGRGFDADRE